MYTTSFSHNEVLTLSSAPQSAPEYIQLFGLQYCLFDLLSRLDKHGSTRVKLYIENEGKGKENWFAVAGGSSYRGFELPRVDCKCITQIQGKSILVRNKRGFELSGVINCILLSLGKFPFTIFSTGPMCRWNLLCVGHK